MLDNNFAHSSISVPYGTLKLLSFFVSFSVPFPRIYATCILSILGYSSGTPWIPT